MTKIVLFLLYLFNAIFICFGIIMFFAFSILYRYINTSFMVIGILLAIWFLIYIIISIKNIFYVNDLIKQNNKGKLKNNAESIKLCSIPFWVINFIILSIFTIGAVMSTRGILIFLVPIPIFVSYIILLGTSIFSISYIRLLYKENKIGYKGMLIYTIFQLMFVFDIFCIIYLKYKYSNKKRE